MALSKPRDPGPVLLAMAATLCVPRQKSLLSLPSSLQCTQGTGMSCKYWEAYSLHPSPTVATLCTLSLLSLCVYVCPVSRADLSPGTVTPALHGAVG